jgi:predicted lipid-binding transport protein (Tim44 family)
MITGLVIGAIVGAVIGAQFFSETGTIVCAIFGGLIGINIWIGFRPTHARSSDNPNQDNSQHEKNDDEEKP